MKSGGLKFYFEFYRLSISRNLFGPSLIWDRVDISTVILITVGVYFAILTQECPLVESVLVWQIACLRDLIQLSIEQVRWSRGVTILLSSEDQYLRLRDRASPEPIFDVVFKALRPDLYQFPVWRLITWIRVKSLYVSDGWFVSSQHIDVSILNRHCRGQVPVSVELGLFAPLVANYWVNLACFRCIVEAGANCIYEVGTNGCETMTFPWI